MGSGPDGAAIACGWAGVGLNVIIALILSFGLIKQSSVSDHIEWTQRHYKPMRIGVFISILYILIVCNLFVLDFLLELLPLGRTLAFLIGNIGFVGTISCYVLRAWVAHYDYHAGLALFLSVTNLEIDEDDAKEFKWFIANKQAYGSPNYLFTFTVFFVIAFNAFLFGWLEVSPTTYEYALFIMYFVLIIVGISITHKLSLLDDNFFIRRELLRQFRVFAGFLLIVGIIIIFGKVMGWNWGLFFLAELSAITFGIMGYFATFWVLNESNKVGMDKYDTLTSASQALANGDNNNKGNFDVEVADIPPISVLFNNPEATAEFIRHLVRELSVENIFFLADVMNYKQQFVKHGLLDKYSNFSCQVPTTLAKVNYNLESFKRYGRDILEMYVDGKSIFVLTSLPDEIRDECIDFWDSLEDVSEDQVDFKQLCHSFDKIAPIIYNVLKGAYQRFAKTPEFDNIDLAENRGARAVSKELVGKLQERNDEQAGGTNGAGNDELETS